MLVARLLLAVDISWLLAEKKNIVCNLSTRGSRFLLLGCRLCECWPDLSLASFLWDYLKVSKRKTLSFIWISGDLDFCCMTAGLVDQISPLFCKFLVTWVWCTSLKTIVLVCMWSHFSAWDEFMWSLWVGPLKFCTLEVDSKIRSQILLCGERLKVPGYLLEPLSGFS